MFPRKVCFFPASGKAMVKTRVVVVDDSALIRSLLKEIIDRQPDMQCVGVAADPFAARETIRNTDPDVITLDIEMPRMDGIDFLAKLMRLRPTPVVMVSTLTDRGAAVTLRALELGAVDFVAKPKIGVADGMRLLAEDITDKIRCAAQVRIRVAEAVVGERLLPGHAYLAPGGFHLSVERSGADGAKAMRAMRDAGAYNVCQDEASCIVFGMPREAIAQGAAHEVLGLPKITPHLLERLRATAGASTNRL